MQAKTVEKARAAVEMEGGAVELLAPLHRRLPALYRAKPPVSSENLVAQAAEVLLVLQLPLSRTSRLAFWALFERRIERAYAGGQR